MTKKERDWVMSIMQSLNALTDAVEQAGAVKLEAVKGLDFCRRERWQRWEKLIEGCYNKEPCNDDRCRRCAHSVQREDGKYDCTLE